MNGLSLLHLYRIACLLCNTDKHVHQWIARLQRILFSARRRRLYGCRTGIEMPKCHVQCPYDLNRIIVDRFAYINKCSQATTSIKPAIYPKLFTNYGKTCVGIFDNVMLTAKQIFGLRTFNDFDDTADCLAFIYNWYLWSAKCIKINCASDFCVHLLRCLNTQVDYPGWFCRGFGRVVFFFSIIILHSHS